MCEWGNTVKMTIAGKAIDVDSCIAPMVKMFNDNGYETIASCCGHGKRCGNIALTDGRFIDIYADRDSWSKNTERIKEIENLFDELIFFLEYIEANHEPRTSREWIDRLQALKGGD